MDHPSCCLPAAEPATGRDPRPVVDAPAGLDDPTLVQLPGGTFLMGCEDPGAYAADGEGPVRDVPVDPFAIEACCVSTARFARFVDDTGYVTDAERAGTGFVFAGFLPDDFPDTRGVAAAPWWREVPGADWAHPEGPQSDLAGRADHPVVQVSWHDAQQFCGWAGLRLPTEAAWEYAARGGLVQQRFPWGNQLTPGGEHRMNVFQGRFPDRNTVKDGYAGTAPVRAFPPNGFGLHNTTGNVWEWTADPWSVNGQVSAAERVLRGGSYLCHASYCWRYRTSARMASTPDSPTGNVGFRCAAG